MEFVLFLNNSRAINVATVVLGTLAGLYGFNTLLGQRGGILRQFIVAVPSAVLFGLLAYLEDTSIHNLYSNIIQTAFQLPPSIDPQVAFVAATAATGFLTPFMMPNLYRMDTQHDKQSPISLAIWGIASGILIGLFYAAELLYLNARGSLPFDIHISRLAAYTISGFVALGTIIYAARAALARGRGGSGDTGSASTSYPKVILGCLFSIAYLALAAALFIPFLSLTGWALVVYTLLAIVVGGVVVVLQLIADTLPQNRLLIVSLVFFLLAAGLQIYQAAVL